MDVSQLREAVDCPACHQHRFEWLTGQRGSHSAVLCGRNAVQLSFPQRGSISLDQLESRLKPLGAVERNRFLIKFSIDNYSITAFPDGRAIVSGTNDIAVARKIHAQYLGS